MVAPEPGGELRALVLKAVKSAEAMRLVEFIGRVPHCIVCGCDGGHETNCALVPFVRAMGVLHTAVTGVPNYQADADGADSVGQQVGVLGKGEQFTASCLGDIGSGRGDTELRAECSCDGPLQPDTPEQAQRELVDVVVGHDGGDPAPTGQRGGDLRELVLEAYRLLGDVTPGEWQYRPLDFDDWGFVRSAIGDELVARGNCSIPESEVARHRASGTDPYAGNARFIAAAPRLVRRLLAAITAHDLLSGAGPTPVEKLLEDRVERDGPRRHCVVCGFEWHTESPAGAPDHYPDCSVKHLAAVISTGRSSGQTQEGK